MRAVAFAVVVILLAGCSSPAADEPPTTTSEGAPRTARGGTNSGVDEPPHQESQFLGVTLDAIGQGPVVFDADVPANMTHVYFILDAGGGTTGAGGVEGLRVELDGCGTFDSGGGYFGSVYYSDLLCSGAAASGAHRSSVSAQAMVFRGARFELWGWLPVYNATAPQS